MLGKVKNWLGIEGVKLELVLPEGAQGANGRVEGVVRLMSMRPQTVTAIRIVLVERYSRGRGEERLVDEYQLGAITLTDIFEVPPGLPVERPFSLPYQRLLSEVDEFGQRNLLFGGVARLARLTRNVQSDFRIEAEAMVQGVALNPFDKQAVRLP